MNGRHVSLQEPMHSWQNLSGLTIFTGIFSTSTGITGPKGVINGVIDNDKMEMKMMKPEEIRERSVQELFDQLDSSKEGLDSSKADQKFKEYGPNEIVEKKAHPLIKFLKNFWSPIPWMIEIAAVISAVIHHWEDFFIILSLLLINAVVSFWQEHKADNAIEMLKKKLALNARVLRDKKWKQVKASELVPGDVIRVRLGDVVPADIKLISGDYLNVDESADVAV